MYAEGERPSIPPERLLKVSLRIALYSVRSERAFCEKRDYHLLYRWFLEIDRLEPSFDPSGIAKNRRRPLRHQVGQRLFDRPWAPTRTTTRVRVLRTSARSPRTRPRTPAGAEVRSTGGRLGTRTAA